MQESGHSDGAGVPAGLRAQFQATRVSQSFSRLVNCPRSLTRLTNPTDLPRRWIKNWDYYMVFAFFRSAAITQGVYKRSVRSRHPSLLL